MFDDGTLRTNIISSIDNQLAYMTQTHNKVFPVRFDLRFLQGYHHDGGNDHVAYFLRRMKQHYDYYNTDCVYVVVREQNTSELPHYHCMFLFDGNKIRSPMGVYDQASHIWQDTLNTTQDGLVHCCHSQPNQYTPPLTMIRSASSLANGERFQDQHRQFYDAYQTAMIHGRYLAKDHTKGSAPKGVRKLLATRVPSQ